MEVDNVAPVYLFICCEVTIALWVELMPLTSYCMFSFRCAGPADVRHLGFPSGERSEVHFCITGESHLVTPAPPHASTPVLSISLLSSISSEFLNGDLKVFQDMKSSQCPASLNHHSSLLVHRYYRVPQPLNHDDQKVSGGFSISK